LQKALKVLILGIGNPGRGDDGLGPALIERLQQNSQTRSDLLNAERVCEFRYQLNVEDALTIKDYDAVVFTDATTAGDSPATLTKIGPADTIAFTTHRMSPASVLALCHELYGRAPKAAMLAIRGYDWDIGERLSPQAEKNLDRAINLLNEFLNDWE
jgi:hydrogenase maturation protease